MAGYLILPEEACDWSGTQHGKVKPNPTRLGITDLVRQFEQNPFPFTRRSPGICLFGLDEFLVQMNQFEDVNENREWPFMQEMRRRLIGPFPMKSATLASFTSPFAMRSSWARAITYLCVTQASAFRYGGFLARILPSAMRASTPLIFMERICHD